MKVPEGFENIYGNGVVLLQLRTIYGLLNAAKAFWRDLLRAFNAMGCNRSEADPCMYFKWMAAEGLLIWLSWIARLVARKPSAKNKVLLGSTVDPSLSSSSLPSSSSDNLVDNEEDVKVVETVDPIETSYMRDVVVSDEPKTLFKSWNKKKKGAINLSYLTRLVSINTIATLETQAGYLRKFCVCNAIPGCSSSSKKKCIDGIVERYLNPPKPKQRKVLNCVNRYRYCNVLFSDKIRPMLSERGAKVLAKGLTQGVKTDELLHRAIVFEYNNSEKYNNDAHPDTTTCSGDPEVFAGPIIWNQSKDVLKSLVRDYKTVFNNWTLWEPWLLRRG